MNAPLTLAACAVLASLAACGPPTASQTPDPATSAPSADPGASAPTAEPSHAPDAPKTPAAEASPHEALARDLVKAGGRRIGYSASKKRFAVPIEVRTGPSRSLDVRFYDDDGTQRENMRVCQPGECEDRLDEIAKELIPKLATRFEQEGYEAVYSIGWPSGREEMDISSLNLKLRWDKGKLSIVREKKPAAPLRVGGGKAPKADAPSALYPVPAAKLLGVFAPGDKAVADFFVYKLP